MFYSFQGALQDKVGVGQRVSHSEIWGWLLGSHAGKGGRSHPKIWAVIVKRTTMPVAAAWCPIAGTQLLVGAGSVALHP